MLDFMLVHRGIIDLSDADTVVFEFLPLTTQSERRDSAFRLPVFLLEIPFDSTSVIGTKWRRIDASLSGAMREFVATWNGVDLMSFSVHSPGSPRLR